MKESGTRMLNRPRVFQSGLAVTLFLPAFVGDAVAASSTSFFQPGDLLLSRVVYDNNASNVQVGQQLPPNCIGSNCVSATYNGSFPAVWNNNLVDGSFGITSQIILDQMTPGGQLINSLPVPAISMVGSFSSKSEVALNLSTDGNIVTFTGYLAPLDTLDVSNSNTPAEIDTTNPVVGSYYRVVAQVNRYGNFQFTKTNAYSGNNGRAAILNNTNGANVIYTAGNAGNGSNPQPNGIIIGAGAQIMTPGAAPGSPTPVGSFNVTQLGDTADKVGKDTNFRGLTIFNNVIYFTKGSGSNGVNTVYFVDTSGFNGSNQPLACASSGVGVPSPSATLPTKPLSYNSSMLQTKGVHPYNMCVLKGFNTVLAKSNSNTSFPFGIWFANATTLYVADEGNGTNTYANGMYTAAAAQTTAGLQKWVFNGTTWQMKYVLRAGLNLGVPYSVSVHPSGNNPATGLPWAPATGGLRNITGRVNGDGTVTIWAVTSTVSGNGDQGADPNKLVMITENLAATSLPGAESFTTIRTAGFAEVLRGVSFTPGTSGN